MVRLRIIHGGAVLSEREITGELPMEGDEIVAGVGLVTIKRRVWDIGDSPLKPTMVALYVE